MIHSELCEESSKSVFPKYIALGQLYLRLTLSLSILVPCSNASLRGLFNSSAQQALLAGRSYLMFMLFLGTQYVHRMCARTLACLGRISFAQYFAQCLAPKGTDLSRGF